MRKLVHPLPDSAYLLQSVKHHGVEILSRWRTGKGFAPGLSALRTAFPADIAPDGLPTTARVLRVMRRSRGRGQALSACFGRLRYLMQRDGAALNSALRIFLRVMGQCLLRHCPGVGAKLDRASVHIGAYRCGGLHPSVWVEPAFAGRGLIEQVIA